MTAPLANDGFIAGHTKRASRNSLIANGILLLCIAALGWACSTYYYFFFRGPVSPTDAQLLEIAQHPGGGLRSYVELSNRVLIPSGWQEIVTVDDRLHSEASYFLMPVEDQFLLVLANTPADGARLLGPIAQRRAFDDEIVQKIIDQQPELQGKILPVVLNNNAAFLVAGYVGLALAAPIVIFCLINVARAIVGMINPAAHRLVRNLKKFGEPQVVASQIDQDVAAGPVMRFGRGLLTSLWLLRPTMFGMTAARLSDLVWVYHLRRSADSFAMLCQRDGRVTTMSLKPDQIDSLLEEISNRVPWVVAGYDAEMAKTWRKDRSAIVALADEQRAAYLAEGR